MGRILIADDKDSMAKMISISLKSEGYDTVIAKNGDEAITKMCSLDIDLIVTDLKMPGKTGLEVLDEVNKRGLNIPVILMTAYGSIKTAVDAVKKGAYDFLAKPFDPDHLIMLVNRALEKQKLVSENIILKEELSKNNKFPRMIGSSEALLTAVSQIKKVALGNTTVLLNGESGTGKELFARSIHMLSPRKNNPMVAINCAAIPKDLMESELFGHEKGAFTGAAAMRIGKFELANNGTLFLDEIGDMDILLQSKLLRILELKEVTRVGGNKPILVDVRVVAATNKNLKKMIEDGTFREDLYFRLSVIPINIPPLRERVGDIRLLAEQFLIIYSKETKKQGLTISEEAYALMDQHNWPGNIRELRNMIERAVLLCNTSVIGGFDLGLVQKSQSENTLSDIRLEGSLHEVSAAAVKMVETQMIKKVLNETGGNKSKAADILQVSYKTLLTKIKDYF